ncbi:2-phosphosulfolactate phosphatase [Vicingaceae bacterium]|jgi:2-phosphosulfolactate phosphatase|nr:2-phosphosulfolactate phosphatase [Vicingaceae bacterium]
MSEESSRNIRKVEVVPSPALFPVYFENKDCTVVVIDVFRATSAICAAFESGIESLIPVANMEQAIDYKKKGYLVGAERNAEIVEGFDFGNSPLGFKDGQFKGETLVLTTTNGTKAIEMAKPASKVVIGAFTNLSAVCDYIEKEDKDVLLLCAGWKDRFNLEDTLFAGAVAKRISQNLRFTNLSDSSIAAIHMYNSAEDDLFDFLGESSHRKRLSRMNMEEDIIYCLTIDQSDIVPILDGDTIVSNK